MTARLKALAAVALVAAAGQVASASTSVLTFTVTNNTSQAWTSLLFEIRAPLTGNPDPAHLAQVLFDTSIAAHSTDRPLATIALQESGKQLRFDFDPLERQLPGQANHYTVTIENPFNSAFRIVRIATPVPTPGAAALAGLGAGVMVMRRRRSARTVA